MYWSDTLGSDNGAHPGGAYSVALSVRGSQVHSVAALAPASTYSGSLGPRYATYSSCSQPFMLFDCGVTIPTNRCPVKRSRVA